MSEGNISLDLKASLDDGTDKAVDLGSRSEVVEAVVPSDDLAVLGRDVERDGDFHVSTSKGLYAEKVRDVNGNHADSRDCWCSPSVLVYPNADVVVHNRGDN